MALLQKSWPEGGEEKNIMGSIKTLLPSILDFISWDFSALDLVLKKYMKALLAYSHTMLSNWFDLYSSSVTC